MSSAVLWVPGVFRLTNGMLSDLRAAGVYMGRRRTKARLPDGWDRFAAETQAIRLAVKAAVNRARPPAIAPHWRAGVSVVVYGHQKHDPDAWYLWAKPAVDGLVDAGVLASDRHNLGTVSGYVVQPGEAATRAETSGDGPGVEIRLDLGAPF